MTQTAPGPGTDGRTALCLSDIDGLDSVIARMPTLDECRDYQLPGDVPVLIFRRRDGSESIGRADQIRLTVAPQTQPNTNEATVAAMSVLGRILEDLDNVRGDMLALRGAADSPRKVVQLAAELRQSREDEFRCAGPCPAVSAAAGQGSLGG